MLYVLALSVAVNVATVVVFLRYLREHDQSSRLERAGLAQRIQSPSTAVAAHVAETAAPDPDAVPLDGPHADQAWWDANEERLKALR